MSLVAVQPSYEGLDSRDPVFHELGAATIVALHHVLETPGREESGPEYDSLLDDAARTMQNLSQHVGAPYTIIIAPSAVLIAGQVLRAPLWVHDCALKISSHLQRTGISEIEVTAKVQRSDVASLVSAAREVGKTTAPVASRPLGWRHVSHVVLSRGFDLEMGTAELRFARTYSSAVVGVRRLLGAGNGADPHSSALVEQMGRRLLRLPAERTVSFLTSSYMRLACAEDAQRAVCAALLAIAVMRRLGASPSVLALLVQTALLLDVDRKATTVWQTVRTLDDMSIARGVAINEVLLLRRGCSTELIYGGKRGPTMMARVLHLSRRLFETLVSRPGGQVDFAGALASLREQAQDATDRSIVGIIDLLLARAPETATPPAPDVRAPGNEREREEGQSTRNGLDGDLPSTAVTAQRTLNVGAAIAGSPGDAAAQKSPTDKEPTTATDVTRPQRGLMRRVFSSRQSSKLKPADDDAPADSTQRASSAPDPARKSMSPPASLVPGDQITDEERQVRAMEAFRAAEAAMSLRDHDSALAEADTAVMLMPHKPAYVALQAYLEAKQGVTAPAVLTSLIEKVDGAFVGAEPDARGYYYWGLLLRHAGKSLASRQAFRRGLEIAPDDVDLSDALSGS